MSRIKSTQHRMQLQKLARLANFLDDLPHDRFHMPWWSTGQLRSNTHCGTAGCAAGWAVSVFHNEGFIFDQMGWPSYLGCVGSDAFAAFFGITEEEGAAITSHLDREDDLCHNLEDTAGFKSYCAEYNLTEDCDITPRHAADRIRKVLRSYDPTLLEEQGKPAEAPVLATCQSR